VSDDWGGEGSEVYARRGRPHAGIDFAVDAGTPIIAPAGGVVTNVRKQIGSDGRGYGLYVDIKIPDGRLMRFAHMSGSYVSVGDQIDPGQVIGKTGDSGSPGQPHLHFEIRDSQREFYFEGSSDPKEFLSQIKDGYRTIVPRGSHNMVHLDNPYTGGTKPPTKTPKIPINSVPLPFNSFILNGNIHEPVPEVKVSGGLGSYSPTDLPFRSFIATKRAVDVYNRANPLPKQFVPSSIYTADTSSNVSGNNFGYAKLAKNPSWSKAIVDFANWAGVPAVWVADVLHFESEFNPDLVNQFGCTGIAQFCGEQRDEFGGINAIKSMGFNGQIELLKKYFTKWGLRGKIRTIAELYTAFQRPALVKRLQKGDYSVLDMKDGNGGSIRQYIEKYIGREAGRKYRIPESSRQSRIDTTHDYYVDGCHICNQLVASNSPLIPHQLEVG
jgi:hypothetical protein